jgi:putative oxidoreductase
VSITEPPLLAPPERFPAFDITGWVLRIAACGVFVGVGFTKFDPESMWVKLFAQIGVGDWFRFLTGALQVIGGLLFLFPETVYVAVAIAGSTMVGAIGVHLFVLDTGFGGAIIPLGLLIFMVAVAARRPE